MQAFWWQMECYGIYIKLHDTVIHTWYWIVISLSFREICSLKKLMWVWPYFIVYILFCFVLILHLVSIGLQRMNVRSIFSLFLFMDPGVGRNALKRFKTGTTVRTRDIPISIIYGPKFLKWPQKPHTDTRKQLTNSNGHRRSWNVCLFVTSLKMRAMSRRMFKISTWNWVAIAQWTKKCQIYGISCK